MKIGPADTSERVALVAEVGNNHEGSLENARALVRAAAEAGADAVKFQTVVAERFVRPQQAERLEQMRRFELTPEAFEELAEIAHDCGIGFLSTPLDLPSADVLAPLVDAFKIASGDNDFEQLMDRVAESGKPLVVSTGASDLAATRAVLQRLRIAQGRHGTTAEVAVLHCTSLYPCPPESANLAAIPRLAEQLDGVTVGYSDHTLGTEACVIAARLGARIVEKHFTLDHDFSEFRDHQLSAEPQELRELANALAAADPATLAELAGSSYLGDGEPRLEPGEEEMAQAIRRSIVAAADLPRGHVIAAADLTWMRPRDGLAPGREGELVGNALVRSLEVGEPILLADLDRGSG